MDMWWLVIYGVLAVLCLLGGLPFMFLGGCMAATGDSEESYIGRWLFGFGLLAVVSGLTSGILFILKLIAWIATLPSVN